MWSLTDEDIEMEICTGSLGYRTVLVTGRVGWDDWDTFGVREAVIQAIPKHKYQG